MENKWDEKKRALNIIWNASEDYSFNPENIVYDGDGNADLYWNYIIGAAGKYLEYDKIQGFFAYLKRDSYHEMYESLTYLGLENILFLKGKKERPAVENLRKSYAEKLFSLEIPPFENNVLNQLYKAHFAKAVLKEYVIDDNLLQLLRELEFGENLNTDEIIFSVKKIIEKYFRFDYGQFIVSQKKDSKNDHQNEKSPQNLPQNITVKKSDSQEKETDNFTKDYIVHAESAGEADLKFEDKKDDKELITTKTIDKKISIDRQYMEKYYGVSILAESNIKSLENLLCTGNHSKSFLHCTRGEYKNYHTDPLVEYRKRILEKQRENNLNFYYENYARNNNSIINLTNKIRNTMLVYFESTVCKSNSGRLSQNNIWRNIYLNDGKIFTKNPLNDVGNISVDILLDSSGSQSERQEIIASQGYIIVESFTRCQIPVKVYSFNSLKSYTVINLFRDYDEEDKNDRIFNYRASGSNRDGLAIRYAVNTMKNSPCENKILIVLSDCKPSDFNSMTATGVVNNSSEYSGMAGVLDTAMEVKKGINKGNAILCVFTGEDEDLPSAKKIYGRNFVRMSSLDRFADIVGYMVQNQLKNF